VQFISLECIMPLCSSTVHRLANAAHSVLFFGPPGTGAGQAPGSVVWRRTHLPTGKTLCAYAVATAARAFFLNLSPKRIAGRYKADPKMLVHLVFKVRWLVEWLGAADRAGSLLALWRRP
jgi:AAA+ superfamily predicted ATPase